MASADTIRVRDVARSDAYEGQRPRMLKVAEPRCDVASAIANLADEILIDAPFSAEIGARALDRLRRAMHGSEAALWVIQGVRAERVLHGGTSGAGCYDAVLQLEGKDAVRARLRPNTTIVCRRGDVSGLEQLVPSGVRSFVAATARSHTLLGVLVMGWTDTTPPREATAAAPHFRVAAALLTNALTAPAGQSHRNTLPDAILGSLSDRIAVVDREGTIIGVNAAWTEFGRSRGVSASAIGRGASYLEVCRSAAAGSPEAAEALQAITAVCRGAAESFESVYSSGELGQEQWSLLQVTPLRRPEGGAVIVHTEMTRPRLIALARGLGEGFFHRLADTMPLPVWVAAPDGRLVYCNDRWAELTGERLPDPLDTSPWTDRIHPGDRALAESVFRTAVARRAPFTQELRLKASDGCYRWFACIGAPRFADDGTLDSHMCVSVDITQKRRAESTLSTVGAKLVAAQEAEYSRLARELHDDLGQQVALLSTRLDTLARGRDATMKHVRLGLATARRILQEIGASIHALSHGLHPAKLRLLGLVQTLDALCRDVRRESGIQVRFTTRGVPANIVEATALCVFRVTQEALQNAVKHSGARRVDVDLAGTPHQLRLTITDAGKGFDPLPSKSAGLGLLTMRERVELSDGQLRVDTAIGRGTTIEATVPLTQAALV